MKRRNFLAAVGGAFGVAIVPKSFSEIQCGQPFIQPNGYAVQSCSVGIPSGVLQFVAARQQSSQWCWAACIQMMFRMYGYDLPQQILVQQTWGSIVNMPAYPNQILAALNRTYLDNTGKRFTAIGDSISTNVATAIQDLANRSPLIIGTLGHATVLTALNYTQSSAGELQVTSAIVRDPWPESPSRRELSPQEWSSINFAARIRCFAV